MDVKRVFEAPGEWVEYIDHGDHIICSAHSDDNKYSIGMFRAFFKVMDINGWIITELPHTYLVEFFSTHYNVENITQDFYTIKLK